MKKIIILLIILTMTTAYSSTGVGAAFTYGLSNGELNAGGALSINTPAIPGTVLNIKLAFDEAEYFNFGVTDDWWVIQRNVTGILDLYVGLGFYAGFTMIEQDSDFSLGARAPIGITAKPINELELFLEIAPAMGVGFEPDIYFPSWNVQGALGARIWF